MTGWAFQVFDTKTDAGILRTYPATLPTEGERSRTQARDHLLRNRNVLAVRGAESPPKFEVAIVKRNTSGATAMKFPFLTGGRFDATNVSLRTLIAFAWNVTATELAGVPDWASQDRYNVNARAASADIPREQYRLMLQSLLIERFNLVSHREFREGRTYELVRVNSGGHLKSADPSACFRGDSSVQHSSNLPVCGAWSTGSHDLQGSNVSMPQLCNALSSLLDRRVTDHTDSPGTFDIHLTFDRESLSGAPFSTEVDGSDGQSGFGSLFTALQQELGLKLIPSREVREVIGYRQSGKTTRRKLRRIQCSLHRLQP